MTPRLPSRRAVISYMKRQLADHTDPATEEVDLTPLAEDAGEHFNLYDADDNLPEELWDWAWESVYGGGN